MEGDGVEIWVKLDVFKIWALGRGKGYSCFIFWWKDVINNFRVCFGYFLGVFYGKEKEEDL